MWKQGCPVVDAFGGPVESDIAVFQDLLVDRGTLPSLRRHFADIGRDWCELDREEAGQARIAAISGLMPMMFMTRVRL